MMRKRSLIATLSLTDPAARRRNSASTQAPTHKEYQ
jgi:hypothetical protein